MDKDSQKEEEEKKKNESIAMKMASSLWGLKSYESFCFTKNDASGIQSYEHFELLEYESLAEKKWKVFMELHSEKMPKKSRKEDVFGASTGKIMEAMNYGNRRKSWRLRNEVGQRDLERDSVFKSQECLARTLFIMHRVVMLRPLVYWMRLFGLLPTCLAGWHLSYTWSCL